MKKLLLSLITAVYMLSASGMVWQVHYCMGEKVGIEFFHSKNEKCGKCGMEERGGCCHDEQKFFKLSQDHQPATLSASPEPEFKFIAPSYWIYCPMVASHSSALLHYNDASPPGLAGYALCRVICVFRL